MKVKKIGVDNWGRSVYTRFDGKTKQIFKDCDGVLHTVTPYGEPDCPLKDGKIEEVKE